MSTRILCRSIITGVIFGLSFAGPVQAQGALENLLDLGRLPYLKQSTFRQISSSDTTGGNADRLIIAPGGTARGSRW